MIGLLLPGSPILADETSPHGKPWHVLGFFDGENAELEGICEYNINQLEEVDSEYAKIVVLFDRLYQPSRDSSVKVYDIRQDDVRTQIISNSISIGERDLGAADVLDEFLSKYIGSRNILVIKAHGYGIISPAALKVGYNSPQNPLVISSVLRQRLESPLEVMIFDSCNMASIEVAYEFKDLVSVLVASQDLMYYSLKTTAGNPYASRPGIDYINLVLNLKPNSNPLTIGKNVVTSFMETVNQKGALHYKATISALELEHVDVTAFRNIADYLLAGITNPKTRSRYLTAINNTLENASRFQPLGRNSILTHYDIEDFLTILEDNLNINFERPGSCVIQSYSNNYVQRASGLSILFFKDLSTVSPVRKKALFEKYAGSKFAKETGWDELMMNYHRYLGSE
jgi:hypothetical protein